MPVRAIIPAALLAACLTIPVAETCLAQALAPSLLAAVPAADSLTPAARTIGAARGAYQAAWAQRQAGEHAAAVETAESGLESLGAALSEDLDAASRRELVELRARLIGVRDVARHQLAAPGSPGNDPDSQVLNAPASEHLEPQFNPDVYRYIEYFTGAGRSVFERWLRRSGRYVKLFRDVLRREGLPADLVHLVFVESGFNLHARSTSAAVGPWQFLRSTGRMFGLTVNQWVDERKDPEKSTVAAARYLKHLYSIFNDWPLALASYNAGEGTILRAIKRQGTTNYWDLKLPRQTEDYVPQFMAVLAISRDPEKYGFDEVELEEPVDFDELALKGTVDLRAIARLADCSAEELRDLNPAVLRHAAPGRDGVTSLRVPKGKAEVILSKLESGATLPSVDLTVSHRVRRGQTLQGIANQYHVDAARLARENGIGRDRPLRRGMVLTVHSGLRTAPIRPAELDPDDPRASTDYVPARPRRLPSPAIDAESDAEGRITHTVRRGETLASIAERYEVSTDDIRRWNRLSSSRLGRGTRLKIRTGDARTLSAESLAADSLRVATIKAPAAASRRARVRHTVVVQPGETLSGIASRHGTTIQRLKRVNDLQGNGVRAGQRLKIPA